MFSSKKVVLLGSIEKVTASQTDILLDILDAKTPDTLTILTGETLRSNSKLYKFFSAQNTILKLDAFSDNELHRWISKELQNLGFKLNSKIIDTIVLMSHSSADIAYKIIEKIDLFADDKKFALQDLLDLFPLEITSNEFSWLDLISQKKVAAAEIEMQNLLAAGKSPFALLGLIQRSYLHYFIISSMLQNGHSTGTIKSKLALRPWLLNKYLQTAKNHSPQELKSKLADILRADSLLKNRSLGDDSIFSALITKLAA